jgi:hypothetical protein
MKQLNIPLIIFLLNSNLLFGQINKETEKFKKYGFDCYNETDSIMLPADFRGPHYFHYVEGSIISFSSPDSCIVSILCGGNAILALDSLYVKTDSLMITNYQKSFNYFNKTRNLFARQDFINSNMIMYENASQIRKDELDKAFTLLRKKK